MEREACKHVGLFIPTLGGGGAEKVMILLANGFAEHGHTVDLVVLFHDGDTTHRISEKVNVVSLGVKRVVACLPSLVRYLRSSRPDVLISALDYANVFALLAAKIARVKAKVIVTEHNVLSLTMQFNKNAKHKLMLPLIRFTYPRAARVIAVSNGVADDLANIANLPRHEIQTIYNPVVSAELLKLSRDPVAHPWIGGALPVIIGVGRLTVAKDFSTLIRAFAEIRKRREARLIILGEGVLRAELEALIRELGLQGDVDMPGFVTNPYAWMSKSSVFALSSAYEGLGNVLIEALACGVPVVSTNCLSGPAEILEGGKWGQLVPVGDWQALAQAIESVFSSDKNQVSQSARANMFSVEKAVDKYLAVIRDIA